MPGQFERQSNMTRCHNPQVHGVVVTSYRVSNPDIQARTRSAQASHWRTRAGGSGWVKKSVITATLSAPAAITPSALSGVMPPMATSRRAGQAPAAPIS